MTTPSEVFSVPLGKRLVLQQYIGTGNVHLSHFQAGQHVFKRDFTFASSTSPGFSGQPAGLVFEPGAG
jgi:hypothetical protein